MKEQWIEVDVILRCSLHFRIKYNENSQWPILNDLREEFENIIKIKTHDIKISKLEAFHDKLSKLKFLDPACGSGNF